MTKARSNAVANAAKGDLTVGNGTNLSGILAVGSNGDTLVADSSTATGLRYQGNFAAGKNAVINGDFYINQRGFTSTTADNTFTFDRWRTFRGGGGTSTYSAETFTLGAAPVAGYEGRNFAQIVTASQSAVSDYSLYIQLLESVRTFAGQTVTLSFWAKAGSGTPQIAAEMVQNFGTGGSPSAANNTAAGAVTISTSWARYSLTIAIPSISGKTIGTNNNDFLGLFFWFSAGSNFNGRASSIGNQNNTFQIWGVQLEAGSVATAFQTATGTIQGELAACQRYYWRQTGPSRRATGFASSSTAGEFVMPLPVQMRIAPTVLEYGGTLVWYDGLAGASVGTLGMAATGFNAVGVNFTGSSGLTTGKVIGLTGNSSDAYIGITAEL
jgi:hypothetical protein